MIPNLLSEVEKAKADFPAAWTDAHTGNSRTEDFIKLLAARLHAINKNFALNGKRGNPLDLSDDALNFLCEADESTGRTPDGKPCVVIDVIASAGTENAKPAWQVFLKAPEANGAWVKPGAASAPVEPPKPVPPPHVCQTLGRDEALDELNALDAYYRAKEGLQRPDGLSLNGKPDFLGIAAWYLDVYEKERITHKKSRAEARAAYVTLIRQSDEWRTKHQGETP